MNNSKAQKLHDETHRVLLDWLEHPPKERRQLQAFELLSDAVQLLGAARINLGLEEDHP